MDTDLPPRHCDQCPIHEGKVRLARPTRPNDRESCCIEAKFRQNVALVRVHPADAASSSEIPQSNEVVDVRTCRPSGMLRDPEDR